MAKAKRKKKKRGLFRKIFFVFELLVLLVLCVGLFLYAQINKKLDVTLDTDFDISKVHMNESVVEANVTKGYQLIALVGLDNTEGQLVGNSDTMLIACINNDTKEIRLVSLYRDTYLRVREDEDGEGIYRKANNAYAVDGPEGLLTMMNSNLDLTISDYVAVGFSAVAETIDLLGGIEVDLTHDEIVHMNNYCVSVSEATGKDYEEIDPDDEGVHKLNGVQATSYARIRYTAGNDFKRAQRQRLIISKIAEKAKKANLSTLNDIMDTVFPLVKTSFTKTEIVKMASSLLEYNIGGTTGFPFSHYMDDIILPNGKKLDSVIPVTLESNVVELHSWLFGTDNYVPSKEVVAYSERIIEDSGYGDEYIERARNASIAALPPAGSEADNM